MSAWQLILSLYTLGVVLTAGVAIYGLLLATTLDGERASARLLLLAPVWPLVLLACLWKGLRYVWDAADWMQEQGDE